MFLNKNFDKKIAIFYYRNMTKIKKGVKILGLKNKEKILLQTLRDLGPLRPINLANKTKVKRTTINFLLKKFIARGLVKRIKIKGHYEWQINDESKMKQFIAELSNYFNIKDAAETIYLAPNLEIEVLNGKTNILLAYEAVLNANKNGRVFVVQGNRSVIASKELGSSYLHAIQNKFRDHKIILEGIIGEKSLQYLQSLPIDTLEFYKNRLVVCYVIHDAFIDFDMDILIFKETVLMINFEKKLVLVVKNQHIHEAVYTLFEVMKLVSRKIDLNKFISGLIKS